VAEETGLIAPIGEWVLRRPARRRVPGIEAGTHADHGGESVGPSVAAERSVAAGGRVMEEYGVWAGRLKLELTESMIMGQGEQAVERLRDLKALGIALSIDDFGTGYSSLAYLKRFPIDELKIDQSFVRDIPGDVDDMRIAAAIIGMAHTLKLRVVAEGVETPEQLAFLKERECDAWQGYLYSKPLPAEEFAMRFLQVAINGSLLPDVTSFSGLARGWVAPLKRFTQQRMPLDL
jgi:EAL domain-containing protein (putative c-di-GMP-specific phosphodiesterase class I)